MFAAIRRALNYQNRQGRDSEIVIAPQYQIEKHCVDFAILVNIIAKEEIKIVVECDGHDFHEKTKAQAAHDKRRNRDLEIAGWRVLRFTGSEIWLMK